MDIAGISSMQNMKIKEISTGMRNHNMLSLLPSYHCLILHILDQSMLILNLLKRNKMIRILKKIHNELSARISAIYYYYGCLGYRVICSWVLYF